MRINITLKILFGFLMIVSLNVFYVVIVYKLSDINKISHILKEQNKVQQGFLGVSNLHNKRKRARLVYDNLREDVSVRNFRDISQNIVQLLDTMVEQLDSVRTLDSGVTQEESYGRDLISLMLNVSKDIVAADRQYDKGFMDIVELDKEKTSVLTSRRRDGLVDAIGAADSNLAGNVDRMNTVIDEQTKFRIKDIESRVANAKQLTMIILTAISVLAALFALFFARAITNPLRKLKESARYIGKGNFYFNPSGYPRDEIGDLASAFFDMALDLKKAQEELVKSKRLAAIGEVVASVNHEINNPLMIISGNAQFLEMSMQDYPAEIQERVRTILEETERISQVTRKLREIRNPVVEDYTSSGEQMINLDKSSNG